MPDNLRRRALDSITNRQAWKSYNELFRSHTKIYDDVFDRGSAPDLESYVDVRANDGTLFAEKLVENMLGLQEPGRHEGRVYILRGDVGRGKSIFSRHLVQKFVPSKHAMVIAAYCDAFDIVQNKSFSEFRTGLRDSLIRSTLTTLSKEYSDECNFFRAILQEKSKGYKLTDAEILDRREKISIEEILDFLASREIVDRVLIVVDNLDECSKPTIELALSFVRDLTQRGSTAPRSQKVSILLPMRDYTVNRYGDTKRFACLDLPEPNHAGVFERKIDMLSELILKDARTFEGVVSASAFSRARREHSVQSIKYQVSRESSGKFLKDLAKYLLTAQQEKDFAPLLKNISAGNCKYLVAGLYNFLHSCKLPLTPLFSQAFLPEFAWLDARQVVPIGIAVECLMAIHFPFYDVDDSSICNIFNAANHDAPNSYENTLVIPKILARLINAGQKIEFGSLKKELISLGYHQKILEQAFKKIAKFGLVTSSEGYQTEDWSNDTNISPNSATKVYLQTLAIEPSYLQYACEDVPMPDEFVVAVDDKYGGKLIGSGSKEARVRSIRNFLAFLEAEEKIELDAVVRKKRLSEKTFMQRYGINYGGRSIRFSLFIKNCIEPRLKKVSNEA